MKENYHLGLLYLIHLLMSADGVVDENETAALDKVKAQEAIPDQLFNQFRKDISEKRGREIYQTGIQYMNQCTDEEKLRVFVFLYKMSEADGSIHVKEVRLLLYCIKVSSIEFDDVIAQAALTAPI